MAPSLPGIARASLAALAALLWTAAATAQPTGAAAPDSAPSAPAAEPIEPVEPVEPPATEPTAAEPAEPPATVATEPPAELADEPPTDLSANEANRLLLRIQQAARTLDYSGVYAYQQGSLMQSSRIVHAVDGTGERERIEVLDGTPREFLRHNERVEHLLPEKQLVVRETNYGERFPGLLTRNYAQLSDRLFKSYRVAVGPTPQRQAGRKCRKVFITPRDAWRYGYRLCVDLRTHLLLHAQMLDQDGTVLEQIAFTSLRLGHGADLTLLATPWPKDTWQVVEPAVTAVALGTSGWRFTLPQGFVELANLQRRRTDNRDSDNGTGDHPVLQLLFSDTLAAISVFIEPATEPADAQPSTRHLLGAGRQGAVNAYGARIADHWLIGVGEVPLATLKAVIESMQYTPPQPE